MPRRRRRWRSGLVVGAAVVVAVIAVGTVAHARSGSAPTYRTAAVTRGPVTATLDLVGTLVPTHSATVGFAQPGTVASVDVSPGQSVTAGQTLAQLDLTALQARLTQAQAAEATARQTLAAAEDGQLPASPGGSPTSARSASGGSAATGAAQAEVEAAQKDVDTARATADADLSAATAACPDPGAASSSPGTPACLDAERALLAAEGVVSGKESALSAAQSALSKALSSASAPPAGGSGASAAQLAAYQAALDAASAAVTVAQQNVDQGSAVSPLSGTVVAVGLTPGQTVAAASSTAVITISAPDGFEVSTTVPTTAVARTAVGQTASVVPDGTSTTLTATVAAIAAAPTSSGYPVTLALPGPTTGLRQGTTASVRLTTGTQHEGIVVPTSAVHVLGTRHVVEVLTGTTVRPTPVTVGIVDPLRTEIVTGLKVGQRVVLADLTSTVTSDSATTTGRGGALGGGPTRRAGG